MCACEDISYDLEPHLAALSCLAYFEGSKSVPCGTVATAWTGKPRKSIVLANIALIVVHAAAGKQENNSTQLTAEAKERTHSLPKAGKGINVAPPFVLPAQRQLGDPPQPRKAQQQ